MRCQRRYFLFGALQTVLSAGPLRPPRRKVVVMLIDGFGPAYLRHSEMPNLRRLAASGFMGTVRAAMPTLTNVNNASVITNSFPEEHGITANFHYDRTLKVASEMDSRDLLLRPTLLERAQSRGWKTAIVSAKDKVRSLCGRGALIEISAERPSQADIERAGEKARIYKADGNYWCMRATRHLLAREDVDIVYLATTDYMMHTFSADEEPSQEHLRKLDGMLGELVADHPKIELYLTADHGMNAKREALDPGRLLKEKAIDGTAVPIIKDNHKVHHGDLGGSCYVYLQHPDQWERAADVLRAVAGIEAVYSASEAASAFRLRLDRIGDLFLLGAPHTAFGLLERARQDVNVRSHGSLHEGDVPLVVYGSKLRGAIPGRNLDLTRDIDFERV